MFFQRPSRLREIGLARDLPVQEADVLEATITNLA